MFPRILSTTHLAKTSLAVIVLINTLEAAVMLPGIAQTSVPSQQRSTPEATQELIINGTLNQNSQQLEKDGSYFQQHTFAGRAGEAITIELSSSEFDAYLVLFDPNSKGIAKNDDGGEGSNAKITITLPTTGTYTVIVNTYEKGEQGSYKLSWREASDKELSLAEATELNQRGIELYKQGKYDEAVPLLEQSLAIRKGVLGDEHLGVATSLNNLAELYKSQGRYTEAEPLFKQALEMRQKLLGTKHPDVAESLKNLAALYSSQGRYTKALSLYQLALKMILEKEQLGSLGYARYPFVATSLNDSALLHYFQGRYTEAEQLFKRALRAAQREGKHSLVIYSFNNLAALYYSQGRYTEAEPFYKQALWMRKKLLGTKHPDVAQSLNNLAALYYSQGRYAEAEPFYKQALWMRKKLLGTEHLDVASSLNDLATLYHYQDRYIEAKLLYKEALKMRKKLLGDEHPDVASSLNNLAALYYSQDRYTEAEPLYKEALKMRKKLLGDEHPDVATSLNNLAVLYYSQGQYTEAELLYQQALETRKKLLGAEHPDVATSLNNLAALYSSQDNMALALQFLERGLEVQEKNLTRNLVAGSESQKQDYLKTISEAKDGVISLHLQTAPDNPTAAALAFTTILRRKGRLLDFLTINQQLLRQQLDSQGQEWLEKLNTIYSLLSTLLYNQPKNLSPEDYRERFADLQQQAKNLEDKIGRRHNEFWEATQPVTIEDIQPLIPVNAALVEFVQYEPYDPKTRKWGEPRYGVYVLTSEGEPQGIDLGTVAEIESTMELFRLSLRDKGTPQQQLKDAARELDQKLMQPVRQLLGSTQQILISPDSNLNLIPFEALVDENNRYLIENYRFTYLSSGRDLLRFTSTSEKRSKKSVLLGNPNFSDKGDVTIRGDFDVSEWILGKLPGTEEEVKAIGELLEVEPLLGTAATEEAVKQVESPFILHIATHGFFETTKTRDDPPTVDSNSLLRSGLVLAGFKQEKIGGDNGLLTALEATGLNLSGTELVVLSACDTGLGGISPGEGIYGLRRAFAIAGSQSQLISLWKVDDEATKELMVKYYGRLLKQNMGRTEALRKTQLEMLRGETERDYSHPYYWASFIPSGNWRAITQVKSQKSF
ncbi:MAG: tetratricopeptide repeat protein [Okeania sp. SIO3B5]|uniref:tetratricopeptide repeat protein n=1 Tax=Okeania sp. SIO3B5 TaxID=2607811 RepID=UPI001401677F|nr:tetratricopeptide repeat protein [Okeania sp. SIO3B5]NEO52816.1 tetratricopeptide repeat protein [Okeania sp. SIO3B5]